MLIFHRSCFLLAVGMLAPAALAQQSARPAPADPAATVPAVEYRSVLDGYQPYRDQEIADWRAVNDEVTRAGGHVGIMGGAGHGASTPAPSPSAEGQPPVRGAPKAPAGDKQKKQRQVQ